MFFLNNPNFTCLKANYVFQLSAHLLFIKKNKKNYRLTFFFESGNESQKYNPKRQNFLRL